MNTASTTRERLLEEAELLMRTRGFSAFSYADIAEKVNIRKASIHHHFPTKEGLGLAIIRGYLEVFTCRLREIEDEPLDVMTKLRQYSGFFADALQARQLPLCGALAAESGAIPDSMQQVTRDFFELHLDWLTRIIGKGTEDGLFRADIRPQKAALVLLSALEGVSLVVWVTGDKAAVELVSEYILAGFLV